MPGARCEDCIDELTGTLEPMQFLGQTSLCLGGSRSK